MIREMKKFQKQVLCLLCGGLVITASYFYLRDTVSITNNVKGKELPIYSVERKEKVVALTFDAAWGNEDTKEILEILERNQVKATFFMTGGWVKAYPEDVKKIAKAGHDLGNHSENHKNMNQLSKEEIKKEIRSVHEKVESLTGIQMRFFRPPYGAYNDAVIKTAEEAGYMSVQWSVDSLDWKDYGAENIKQTVLENEALQNGAILLFHNGAKYTKDALEEVICGLKEQGYTFLPLSRLLYTGEYYLDVTGRQHVTDF